MQSDPERRPWESERYSVSRPNSRLRSNHPHHQHLYYLTFITINGHVLAKCDTCISELLVHHIFIYLFIYITLTQLSVT